MGNWMVFAWSIPYRFPIAHYKVFVTRPELHQITTPICVQMRWWWALRSIQIPNNHVKCGFKYRFRLQSGDWSHHHFSSSHTMLRTDQCIYPNRLTNRCNFRSIIGAISWCVVLGWWRMDCSNHTAINFGIHHDRDVMIPPRVIDLWWAMDHPRFLYTAKYIVRSNLERVMRRAWPIAIPRSVRSKLC